MPARELRDSESPEAQAQPQSQPMMAQLDPESPLIVPDLARQRLAVEVVLVDFDAAKSAREQRDYGYTAKGEKLDFDKWLKELTDLYTGHREPKTVPWQYCSNRSMMIGMAILEVLHARIMPAVYNEDLVTWKPIETTDIETAERITKLMNWWTKVHCNMREFFDRWVRYTIGYGSTTVASRWDVHLIDKGKVSQPEPIVNPDGTVTVAPPEKELTRVEKTRSDIIPIADVFWQIGATDPQRDTLILRRKCLYRDLEELEAQGVLVNIKYQVDPNQPSLRMMTPVASAAGEGISPEERDAIEDIRRRNVPIECLEWHGGYDLDGDGFPEQLHVLIVPEHKLYLGATQLKDTSKRGMRHIDHTLFIPRLSEPSSLWGLGILEQVKELALELDAIFNQMTDANSMSVLRPGFYDPNGDLDAAALSLSPNKWSPVPRPKDNVYMPEIDIPTERLINAIRMILEFIERLTAASAYIMGKESEVVGGSGTATRTEAIVGAANQRHSIPISRLREGAARIMTQHLDLIQTNLTPGMETMILGDKGEPLFDSNELRQDAIASDMNAALIPDESMGNKETERQLSQMLYQMLVQNIIVASDPAKLYKITADVLKSYGKDAELYLGIAPDVKQTDRPEDENTLVLQGQFASVKASVLDNHLEHIMAHTAFLQDPAFQKLPPTIIQQVMTFMQGHIQEHMQLMQVMMQMAQQQKGQGGGIGQNGQPQPNGNPKRGAGNPKTVGPEPGMGSVQQPRAAAGAIQRTGESQPPS